MAKTKRALKKTQAKSKEKMNVLAALFVAGCLLETYLLLVHQFYTRGTGQQMLATARVLTVTPFVGLVIAAAGVVLLRRGRGRVRGWGGCCIGSGLFLAVAALLCLKVNSAAAGMLGFAVPIALLLAVVYELYVSEFFWIAASLTATICALWYWRRCFAINYLRASALVLMLLALAAVAAVAVLSWRALRSKGVLTFRGRRFRMLEADGDKPVLFGVYGLCLAALLVSLCKGTLALYAICALCVVLFAAAVYYTITAL
ncbi:MAG: hypothetical protein ACI3WR_00895 [Oscillospiraceae bacterium]